MFSEIYNYIDSDIKFSDDKNNKILYLHTNLSTHDKTDWSDIRNYLRSVDYKLGFIIVH